MKDTPIIKLPYFNKLNEETRHLNCLSNTLRSHESNPLSTENKTTVPEFILISTGPMNTPTTVKASLDSSYNYYSRI